MKPSHYTFRCGLIFTSLYTPSLIGLVVTAGIATLRYIAIRSTIKNPINDNYAASLCTLILHTYHRAKNRRNATKMYSVSPFLKRHPGYIKIWIIINTNHMNVKTIRKKRPSCTTSI